MTAESITVRCSAKVNLYLDVIRRRDDGYHDIVTVFQPVTLHDIVSIRPVREGISLEGDARDIPWDSSNLCWKAAELILKEDGEGRGVSISVTKNIPAGAGLGGGSSDAAAVLFGVNELLELGIGGARPLGEGPGVGAGGPRFFFSSPGGGGGGGGVNAKSRGGCPGGRMPTRSGG